MTTAFEQKRFDHHHYNGRWLVVDFDGTCTARDTTPILPKLASMLDDNVNIVEQQQRLSKFSELEKEYFRLYETAKTEELCPQQQTLDEALDVLDQVSNQITEKVSNSRVLKGLYGVPSSKIQSILEEQEELRVMLLPECLNVISDAMKTSPPSWKLGILSINWCPSLIDAVLLQPILKHLNLPDDSSIPIWSNSVDEDGVVSLNVPGALAKRDRIRKLLRETKNDNNNINEGCRSVIYIGDSSTDLLGLREANVGILIGNSQSTIKMAKKWGISLSSLTEWEEGMDTTTIWIAENWKEIGEFLKKYNLTPAPATK